jgi:hypothetical protein
MVYLKSFNPEEYGMEITVVEMRGLGRGRGLEVTGEYSATDDEDLTIRISERLNLLLNYIEGDPSNARARISNLPQI